jgi:hypothetical protein
MVPAQASVCFIPASQLGSSSLRRLSFTSIWSSSWLTNSGGFQFGRFFCPKNAQHGCAK